MVEILIGIMIGAPIGYVLCCLMVASKEADEMMDKIKYEEEGCE